MVRHYCPEGKNWLAKNKSAAAKLSARFPTCRATVGATPSLTTISRSSASLNLSTRRQATARVSVGGHDVTQSTYLEFHNADMRWSALLRQQFGARAGDARYSREGKGESGTALRQAHDAFCAARDAWYKQVELRG